MGQQIKLEIGGEEKFIGMLEGGTLHIQRTKKKHFYRKLNAYGMDRELLEKLQEMDCDTIRLHEKDTDEYYETTLELFLKKGLPNNYAGHGAQLFLPIRRWTKL